MNRERVMSEFDVVRLWRANYVCERAGEQCGKRHRTWDDASRHCTKLNARDNRCKVCNCSKGELREFGEELRGEVCTACQACARAWGGLNDVR
jgi:hypothetical protein